jgi:hypothetical protein
VCATIDIMFFLLLCGFFCYDDEHNHLAPVERVPRYHLHTYSLSFLSNITLDGGTMVIITTI